MRTENALQPGQYDIRPHSRGDHGKCVITGVVYTGVRVDDWTGFEAAHIFPLSSYWLQSGFSRWITNREDERATGINLCQNGLLMQCSMHQKFDGCHFSVNPDDGYKITCFDTDPFSIDGRILDPICRDPNSADSARNELLRWHFRQAVLANMRGAGEPSFEMDFPPESDMMGEILSGPRSRQKDGSRALLKIEWDILRVREQKLNCTPAIEFFLLFMNLLIYGRTSHISRCTNNLDSSAVPE
ncbi:hypothetical protein V1520DRAFT_311546 [Lipomyces starkeyi]